MLIIGSQAAKHWGILQEGLEPRDTDIICTFEEFQKESARIKEEEGIIRCVPLSDKKFHIRNKVGWNYEFEIAWPGSSGADLLERYPDYTHAAPETLLALKLSHRYLKDSPHFLKTMRSIQHFRALGIELSPFSQEWLPKREAETYVYNHPKLNVSKGEFFNGDGVNYVYDHDEIHTIVAVEGSPAYMKYADGEVWSSKEKFASASQRTRLLGGLEESMVLALERSQIPHGLGKEGGPSARYSFELALMKVCTSITSGFFREFCWEHYDQIMSLYEELGETWYVDKFKEALQSGKILPRDV